MTVQELVNTATFCDLIEVIVRKNGHGQWIQGYRVGKDVKIYPSEVTAELREINDLKVYETKTIYLNEGEIIDLKRGGFNLPMKVICKDCHRLPDAIGNLIVCSFQPRHIPIFHKDALTSNNFSMYIDCYPDNYIPLVEVREVKEKIEQLEGQMSIEDWNYGGNK